MVLCGLPGSYFPEIRTFWQWFGPDKIVHSLMFGVFAFLVIFGYRKEYCERGKTYRIKLQLITFLIVSAYGALTEFLQRYVFIGRSYSEFDICADVIGCLLGIFAFKIIFSKKIVKK